MATPLKPWERNANSSTPARPTGAPPTQAPQFSSLTSRVSNTPTTPSSSAAAAASVPSVPPRSTTTQGYLSSQPYMPGFGGYSSYAGGYSSYAGGYGNYGYGYRPYGGVGGMYGGGTYGNVESPFLQQAEESTRSAFQSVESVVGAVSSISAMLESTYFAVHSCFRAVLGVAQHFTRLRNYVWGIVSAIALLHRLRYWLRKLLGLFRLRRSAERAEDVWEESSIEQDSALWLANANVSSSENRVWPAVLFFAMVFGVPWLLWRLLTALATKPEESTTESWSNGSDQPVVTARALYDFTPQRDDELAFSAGDELVLAPRQLQSGWVLAGKDRKSGLIPVNYIQIVPGITPGSARGPNSLTPPTSTPHPLGSNGSTTPPNTASSMQQLHERETLLND